MSIKDKIIFDWNQLAKKLQAEQAKGKKVVFTNGCFDILHRGHVSYLEDAQNTGDILVVALNTDASIKKLNKGDERPINNLEERTHMMAALESVNFVTSFAEDTPLEALATLKPDVIVKGGDYSIEEIVGSKEVLAGGGEAYSLPFVVNCSTTEFLDNIFERLNAVK